MAKIIPGVPESITRAQYLSMIEPLGFNVDQICELRFMPDGVHAVLFAYDSEGNQLIDRKEAEAIKHTVYIPVEDAQ